MCPRPPGTGLGAQAGSRVPIAASGLSLAIAAIPMVAQEAHIAELVRPPLFALLSTRAIGMLLAPGSRLVGMGRRMLVTTVFLDAITVRVPRPVMAGPLGCVGMAVATGGRLMGTGRRLLVTAVLLGAITVRMTRPLTARVPGSVSEGLAPLGMATPVPRVGARPLAIPVVAICIAALWSPPFAGSCCCLAEPGISAPIFCWDRLPRQALDILQVCPLLVIAERDGNALSARARRTADAVDVALGDVRQLVIDNVAHLVDIDTARGNIRGDEGPDARTFEGFERPFTLNLALVAVDGRRGDAGRLQMQGHTVGAPLRAREDERAAHGRIGEKLHEQRALPLRLDKDDALGNAISRLGDGRDGHLNRLAQQLGRQRPDLVRHGRREEEALTPARQLGNDLPERADEAQIQHLIGLVQHEDLCRAEIDVAFGHVIDKPSGGGDEHVEAARHHLRLWSVRNAAENDANGETQVAAVGPEAFRNLGGKLTRWRENEGASPPARGWPALGSKAMEDGQRKGSRLAGARLSNTEDVATLKNAGNGLRLDRRWRGVAFGLQRLQNGWIKTEIGKCSQRSSLSHEAARAKASRSTADMSAQTCTRRV